MSVSVLRTYDSGGNLLFTSENKSTFLYKEYTITPSWRPAVITTGIQQFSYTFTTPVPLAANMFGIIVKGPVLNGVPSAATLAAIRDTCSWVIHKNTTNYTGVTFYAEAENPGSYIDSIWKVQLWTYGVYY